MTTLHGIPRAHGRAGTAMGATLLALLVLLTAMVLAGLPLTWLVALVAIALSVVSVAGRVLFRWHNLTTALLVIILFIPIGRYSLPSSLPFQLEPYRLFVVILVMLWLTSLLIDPSVRLRPTGFEAPVAALLLVILASELMNAREIGNNGLFSEVAKKLTFFLSFVAVLYAVVSVTSTRAAIDRLLKVIAGGGAVVALFAIVEARTGFNVFAHLRQVIPLLQEHGVGRVEAGRGGRLRVYASSQHPIALGAALVMLVPVGVYIAKSSGRRRWWVVTALTGIGSLATISRTSVLMLVVELTVYLILKPHDLRRLWMFAPIGVVVIHLMIPGTLGSLKDAFFPQGGLIAQQADAQVGSGRVATLGPTLDVWEQYPLFGVGYGTRIVDDGPKKNANILDDQWLGTLLETGLLGLLVWVWLFVTFVRTMMRAARESGDPEAWLFGGLAAAVGSFAFGMAFYDAFAFIQVTFLMFVLIALGAASLRVLGPGTSGSVAHAGG